mmetsp:Transcript_20884/g.66694  ORF Transcript_20884/g.66694 Transcript_20884/m.66694 type:complete len:217 (+) Transcript_20884:151-801(+)
MGTSRRRPTVVMGRARTPSDVVRGRGSLYRIRCLESPTEWPPPPAAERRPLSHARLTPIRIARLQLHRPSGRSAATGRGGRTGRNWVGAARSTAVAAPPAPPPAQCERGLPATSSRSSAKRCCSSAAAAAKFCSNSSRVASPPSTRSVTALSAKKGTRSCWQTQATEAASISLTDAPSLSSSARSVGVQSRESEVETTPTLSPTAAARAERFGDRM